MLTILGISAYYHDSAAVIIQDGEIIAAAQEERFSRKKHDPDFPYHAIKYCLSTINRTITELDYIVFYDKPLLKFERLLETYIAFAPRGFKSFYKAMPIWLKEKLYLKQVLKKEFQKFNKSKNKTLPELLFTEHHQSHAASAFFPSPFEEAAILCMDGVGEWATTSIWKGENNNLEKMYELNFPHSLGLLYSAFTYYCGFKVNSGEYKLMGLAPYGNPVYQDIILNNLIDLKEDGSFHMDMKYFDYPVGLKMTNNAFSRLFGGPPRIPESEITQREMDMAASIQKVTEEIVLRLAKTARSITHSNNLCLAGGVALNCVANGKLLRENIFNDIWIQPAAGDAGGALGAAMSVYYEYKNKKRNVTSNQDKMYGSFLGPSFNHDDIRQYLDSVDADYILLDKYSMYEHIARLLESGNIIGWFQGKMEFGPRALGARSILGDPRIDDMQSRMNLKIKFRESFRPFAPSVIAEKTDHYFNLNTSSPYMLIVSDINEKIRVNNEKNQKKLSGIDKLKIRRSSLPAVTHVDYSARVQSVHKETNPEYYALLDAFEKLTGCAVLVNTSFNIRGEPIVCTPADAYRCFMKTDIDYLVIENFLLDKRTQHDYKKTIYGTKL